MQLEKLVGPLHVKSAMAELSRSERDDGESVKYSELFYGRHFNGTSYSDIVLLHLCSSCNLSSVWPWSLLIITNPFCFFATVVFIGGVLFALQQFSGINSVFYFSSTVFRGVGVPANLASICMGISNLSGEHPCNSYTVLLYSFHLTLSVFSPRFNYSNGSNGQVR